VGGRGALQRGQRLAPALLGVGREQRLHRREQLTGLERAALEVAQDAPRPRDRPGALATRDLLAVAAEATQHQTLDAERGRSQGQ
jgi:hypothetical protein